MEPFAISTKNGIDPRATGQLTDRRLQASRSAGQGCVSQIMIEINNETLIPIRQVPRQLPPGPVASACT